MARLQDSGEGIDPELWSQAWPLEESLAALGVSVWPMVDVEADDRWPSAAAVTSGDPDVEQVIICTPDKDLGQCVQDTRGPARPAQEPADRRGRDHRQVSVWRPPPSPTTSPSSGTAPTGSRGCPAGVPSPPPPSWPDGPSRGHPTRPRGLGRHGARGRQAGDDPAGGPRRRGAVQGAGHAPDRSLHCCVGWRTSGGAEPTDDFPRLCAEFDARGLGRRAEALAAAR